MLKISAKASASIFIIFLSLIILKRPSVSLFLIRLTVMDIQVNSTNIKYLLYLEDLIIAIWTSISLQVLFVAMVLPGLVQIKSMACSRRFLLVGMRIGKTSGPKIM